MDTTVPAPTTPTTPYEVLERAADLIERDGLAIGEYFDDQEEEYKPGCSVCVLAALSIVTVGARDIDVLWYDLKHHEPAAGPQTDMFEASRVLAEHLGGDVRDQWEQHSALVALGSWSDRTGDAARVAAELRAAAAAYRAGSIR